MTINTYILIKRQGSIDDRLATLPPFEWKRNASLDKIHNTASKVEEIISTLNDNKATGPDFISHKVRRSTSKSISKPLSALFNKSLQSATFPSKRK